MNKLRHEAVGLVTFLLIIYIGIFANVYKYGVGDSQVFFVSILALSGWSLWFSSFAFRLIKQAEREK